MEKSVLNHTIMQKKTFTWPQTIGLSIITILLVTGVWTAIQMGPYFPQVFNRLMAAVVTFTQSFIPAERLTVYASPNEIKTGEEVALTWAHQNQRGDGTYSLSYPCQEGIYLGVKVASGEKTLLCDKPSDIFNEENIVTLKIFNESTSRAEVPVTLRYTKENSTDPSLSAAVILSVEEEEILILETPEVIPPAPQAPAPKPITPAPSAAPQTLTPGTRTEKTYTVGDSSPATTPFGKVDLAPKILDIGVIDKITNVFTPTTTLKVSDRIAVKFEVENIGTAASGDWYFSAVLPTYPMFIFQSESQQTLNPGDKIEYTIGFDQAEPDVDGRFLVNVDPNSALAEASETNNMATATIRALVK